VTPYTLLYRIRKLKRRATVTLTRRKYRLLLIGCCSLFLFLRGLLPSQGFGFMECCSCLNPGFIRHRFTCVCVARLRWTALAVVVGTGFALSLGSSPQVVSLTLFKIYLQFTMFSSLIHAFVFFNFV
jgi:hypothetical protein